jgi:hypothetical protein
MKKLIKTMVAIMAIAFVLEVAVFNFRAIQSIFFQKTSRVTLYRDDICPPEADPADVADELGGTGSYAILYPYGTIVEEGGRLVFPEDEAPQIMVLADGILAGNLYLDAEEVKDEAEEVEEDDGVQDKLDVKLSASDEGSFYHYDLPKLTIYQEEPATRYIRLNLSGRLNSLCITFPGIDDNVLIVHDIGLNVRRPFMFSAVRLLSVFAVLAAVWCMRPASIVWQSRYSLDKGVHLAAVILLALLQVVLITNTTLTADRRVRTDYRHHRQYYKLAVALSEGHYYLEDEPSEELMAMDNPYDNGARKEEGVNYLWDTAYFNGKYYCYFGILPVLTYYLPYYLATGNEFPAYVGTLIHLLVAAVMMVLLLDEIFRQYFPYGSLGEFIVMELSLAAAGALLVTAQTLTFYVLPVSMALMLAVTGLYFWLRARRGFSSWRIVAGAACMALTAACRPQFALASFLVFPILGEEAGRRLGIIRGADVRHVALEADEAYEAGEAENVGNAAAGSAGGEASVRRKTALTVASALIPYVVVAGFLMHYNYARFGSPFDFGANYNLTTNDMTHRGFHADRLPFGFFTYLLQPPYINGVRPYMQYVSVSTAYQGRTVYEGMQGGLLWFVPLLGGNLLLLSRYIRERLREKKLMCLTAAAFLLGVLVVGIDIQVAGILQRYWMDFGFFLMLSSACCLLTAGEAAAKAAMVDENTSGAGVAREGRPWIYNVPAYFLFFALLQTAMMWGLWMYRFL